jgi:hypothetical protein
MANEWEILARYREALARLLVLEERLRVAMEQLGQVKQDVSLVRQFPYQ